MPVPSSTDHVHTERAHGLQGQWRSSCSVQDHEDSYFAWAAPLDSDPGTDHHEVIAYPAQSYGAEAEAALSRPHGHLPHVPTAVASCYA
eukprot:1345013-Amphidinium_carterae.1